MCKSEDCLKGLKLVKFTKIPCDDFLMMGLRYQHIDPPSPDVDYIAIRVVLMDTRSSSVYKVIWLCMRRNFTHVCDATKYNFPRTVRLIPFSCSGT